MTAFTGTHWHPAEIEKFCHFIQLLGDQCDVCNGLTTFGE